MRTSNEYRSRTPLIADDREEDLSALTGSVIPISRGRAGPTSGDPAEGRLRLIEEGHRRLSELVVVGFDGSEADLATVVWAAGEARRRNARLMVVHAWSVHHGSIRRRTRLDRYVIAHSNALAVLEAGVLAAVEDGADVIGRLAQGEPTSVLSRTAEGADLLVLGRSTRGSTLRSRWRVPARCARRMGCPLVLVPPGWGANSGPSERDHPSMQVDHRHPASFVTV